MRNGKLVWLTSRDSMIAKTVSFDDLNNVGIAHLETRFWIPADAKMEGL